MYAMLGTRLEITFCRMLKRFKSNLGLAHWAVKTIFR